MRSFPCLMEPSCGISRCERLLRAVPCPELSEFDSMGAEPPKSAIALSDFDCIVHTQALNGERTVKASVGFRQSRRRGFPGTPIAPFETGSAPILVRTFPRSLKASADVLLITRG